MAKLRGHTGQLQARPSSSRGLMFSDGLTENQRQVDSPGPQSLDLRQQLELTHIALHHLQQGGAQLRPPARHRVIHQPRCAAVHLRTRLL